MRTIPTVKVFSNAWMKMKKAIRWKNIMKCASTGEFLQLKQMSHPRLMKYIMITKNDGQLRLSTIT